MRTTSVSVLGITVALLLSVIATDRVGDQWPFWFDVAFIVVAVITVLLAGRYAPAGWSPEVGAGVAMLLLVARGIGSSIVDPWWHASDLDSPAWLYVVAALIGLVLPAGLVGALFGWLGTIGTSRGERA